jgi:hypothetical protein
MKPAVAVDTNVPIIANGSADVSSDCTLACIRRLREVRASHRVLLDTLNLILTEYRKNLSPRGQPGLGDAFFKWLWDNQANAQVCRRVSITAIDGSFAEFPSDPDLARFHRDDRKFVAVVLASGEQALVLNASDTDWWIYREALHRNGVEVEFLCPALMVKTRE